MAATATKDCEWCGERYDRHRSFGKEQWAVSRFCSRQCRGASIKGISTGPKPLETRAGTEVPCSQCGKMFYVYPCETKTNRGRFCSQPCSYKGRVLKATFQPGSKHPSWIDGNAGNGYSSEFSPSLKKRIRERDGYACQLCGIDEAAHKAKFGRVLCVNHIDFDKANCSERNLNTLCIGCNTRINFNRVYWTAHFIHQMEVRCGF